MNHPDTSPTAPSKPRRFRRLASLLLVLAWLLGPIGWATRHALLLALPRQTATLRIDRISPALLADPPIGVVVRVSAPRLRQLAREALGWKAWLIPPNTLPRWLTLSAETRVQIKDDAEPIWLPLVVRIVPDLTRPEVFVRLPSHLVNEALDYDGSFTQSERTQRYALGRYTTMHWLRFDTVSMRSTLTERAARRAVTHRRVEGSATGQVRFKLEENWFNARSTVRVRSMTLRCDLDFHRYLDGISLAYRITIPELDADIRHLAPLFERRPVESIRQLLERSIARPRNLERLARRRLPHYLPLDTELEIEVFKADPAAPDPPDLAAATGAAR